jgi:hypothetical protein
MASRLLDGQVTECVHLIPANHRTHTKIHESQRLQRARGLLPQNDANAQFAFRTDYLMRRRHRELEALLWSAGNACGQTSLSAEFGKC